MLPTRLGVSITPNIGSLILISKNARITRPKAKIPGIETIIKNDQIKTRIDKILDNDLNVLSLAKVISTDTLENFTNQLAKLHKPIEFNWEAKFGVSKTINNQFAVNNSTANPTNKDSFTSITSSANTEKSNQKLICSECNIPVTYNVAKFCWFNKTKFKGRIFCMECQKKI